MPQPLSKYRMYCVSSNKGFSKIQRKGKVYGASKTG